MQIRYVMSLHIPTTLTSISNATWNIELHELQSSKFSTRVLLNFCRMQYESVEYRAVFWLFFSTTICPKKCLIIIISFYKEQVQAIKGPLLLGKLVHTYTEIKLCLVWVWCFLSFKQHTGLFQKESTAFFSKMKQIQLLFKGQIARPDRKPHSFT